MSRARFEARRVGGEWCVWSVADARPYEDAEDRNEATYKAELLNDEAAADRAAIDADRDLEQRNEAKREAYERKARERGE